MSLRSCGKCGSSCWNHESWRAPKPCCATEVQGVHREVHRWPAQCPACSAHGPCPGHRRVGRRCPRGRGAQSLPGSRRRYCHCATRSGAGPFSTWAARVRPIGRDDRPHEDARFTDALHRPTDELGKRSARRATHLSGYPRRPSASRTTQPPSGQAPSSRRTTTSCPRW